MRRYEPKDYKQLASKSIETLVDRGMDFLVKEAEAFVKDNNLYKFSKSQVYGLCSEVNKGTTFPNLRESVEEWLCKQSEKKTGGKWKEIEDELLKKMFEWDNNRIKNISDLARKLIEGRKRFKETVDDLLTEENLTEDLKFRLAQRFFHAVLASYRCYTDNEIRKKLEDMQLCRLSRD